MGALRHKGILGLKILVATGGFLITFQTVLDLMLFLSHPSSYTLTRHSEEPKWTWSLIINTLLLSLFVLQHSLCALPAVKEFFIKIGFKDLQRSIYVIMTCSVLEVLICNWQYTNEIYLWKFSLENPTIYYPYMIAHSLGWILIYIGNICMDINELLGLKQVYYSAQQLPDPITLKAMELQKLYANMRHPSFIGFIIIFWCVPILRFDRVLLALFMTAYMYISWKTDDMDLNYQRAQMARKFD